MKQGNQPKASETEVDVTEETLEYYEEVRRRNGTLKIRRLKLTKRLETRRARKVSARLLAFYLILVVLVVTVVIGLVAVGPGPVYEDLRDLLEKLLPRFG